LGRIISTNLVNDSANFDGFIIFEFNKNDNEMITSDSSKYVSLNFFFVDSISNIIVKSKRCYFDSYSIILQDFYYKCITKTEKNKQDSEFVKFFEFYNNYKYRNSTFMPFLYRPLNTEIFFQDIEPYYLNNDINIIYFVFKVSFNSTTFLMKRERKDNSNENRIVDLLITFPVSKSCMFEPVEESKILENGFLKSNWFPNYLFITK
jgi:hypothetical protein